MSHWYLLVASEAKPIKDRTVERITILESTQQIVISVGSDCFYDSTAELHRHTLAKAHVCDNDNLVNTPL